MSREIDRFILLPDFGHTYPSMVLTLLFGASLRNRDGSEIVVFQGQSSSSKQTAQKVENEQIGQSASKEAL